MPLCLGRGCPCHVPASKVLPRFPVALHTPTLDFSSARLVSTLVTGTRLLFTKLEAAARVYSWSPQAVTRLTPSRAHLVS